MSVGNKVKFLNENLSGNIKSILPNNKLVVEANDGFDYEVAINEVVVVNEDNSHHYKVDENEISHKIIKTKKTAQPSTKGVLDKYVKSTKYQYEKIVEVDLHLEKLVEFPQSLDDWQKLHTQMQHLKNCLNAALEEKVKKIVFIHGVGTGVLKIEIRNYLANYPNLTVRDADYREYGAGATEVIIG